MYHYRKTFKKYKDLKQSDGCPFCGKQVAERIIAETKYAFIIPNAVSYDLWENIDVAEHLLLIPKKHVETLSELTAADSVGIMGLMSKYQAKGYNVYARGNGSIMGTVKHQHTHLIKTKNNRRAKFVFFLKKPRMLFKL